MFLCGISENIQLWVLLTIRFNPILPHAEYSNRSKQCNAKPLRKGERTQNWATQPGLSLLLYQLFWQQQKSILKHKICKKKKQKQKPTVKWSTIQWSMTVYVIAHVCSKWWSPGGGPFVWLQGHPMFSSRMKFLRIQTQLLISWETSGKSPLFLCLFPHL